MAKSSRGHFTVEFYSLLPLIRQKYESGIVVAKIIYNELYNDKKITMTYNRFAVYFKKEISGKTKFAPKKNDETLQKNDSSMTDQRDPISDPKPGYPDWKPIIIRSETTTKPYNPHTREINEDDIL